MVKVSWSEPNDPNNYGPSEPAYVGLRRDTPLVSSATYTMQQGASTGSTIISGWDGYKGYAEEAQKVQEAYNKKFNEIVQQQSTNPKDKLGISKPPMDTIPPSALIHLAMAMGNGAEKYGAYNWRDKAVKARIYVGAVMRHIMAYLDGENYARDSEVHHLGHAMACLAILLDAEETGNLLDDRPSKGKASDIIERFTRK